jgi:hypothetical protein
MEEVTPAWSFFSTQMLIHVIRNLMISGLYNEETAIHNIKATLSRGIAELSPSQHETLRTLAQSFEEGVRDAASQKPK